MTGVELLHITTDDESYKLTGDTVVIGGGNVAIDVSRTAIRCGSPKVSQVSLETRDIMPALPEEIETAESEGINIIGGWGPKEIITEDGKVTGIVFKKCTSVKDADGRFNPQYDENETMTIECSNVIMSVDRQLNGAAFLKVLRLNSGMVIILLLTRLHIRQQSQISLSVVMYIQVLNLLLMLLRQVSRGLYLFTDMYSHTAHLQ